MRAGIALGSNLSDRLANLQRARAHIRELVNAAEPILQSSIYETAAVDCEAGAPNFYNAVIEIDSSKSPDDLLKVLKDIEQLLGRAPDHARNISRVIDLDLLYYGELQCDDPELQLPHPRMIDREFVLRPLANIRADLRLPGQTASIVELLARLKPSESVKCVITDW